VAQKNPDPRIARAQEAYANDLITVERLEELVWEALTTAPAWHADALAVSDTVARALSRPGATPM
jgi:hypothetical protein